MKKERAPGSLKWGLTLATILCWILPILIVTATAAVFINYYYDTAIRDAADAGAENALRQVELRLASAQEDSKAVSYEGVVRQAYRRYQQTGSKSELYRAATEYLSQKYSRNASFTAVYISFLDKRLSELHPYAAAQGVSRYNVLRNYTESILPQVRETLDGADTGMFYININGGLYMARYLLDSGFEPYAILVMGLEKSSLLQSLYNINGVRGVQLAIDGEALPLYAADAAPELPLNPTLIDYRGAVDGHAIVFTAQTLEVSLWSTVPMLRWAILFILLLVLPLLVVIIWLFHRNVNHPIEVLIDANSRVQAGERGYTIPERAPSQEFRQLYNHFNSMSTELKSQFDRLYLEQQALQQAKIKALQSQINPHFLNNTLEIINWEARFAENERVVSMIEALSTMLDAAIGRDGRAEIRLREELEYVDAYLYIIKERIGERLHVTRDIDAEMLDCIIPRLMLQPIVENAVEHDLTRAGGELCIRAHRAAGALCFEVEHDGCITAEGWESIRRSLAAPAADGAAATGGSVGLRNVCQRLRLLYGEDCTFTITEPREGRILARIVLPERR